MLDLGPVITIVVILLLAGCAATSKDSGIEEQALKADFESKEQMFKQTSNHGELIRLYKSELLKNETPELRAKLVEQYIHAKDFESADFQLSTMDSEFLGSAKGLLLRAQVDYYQKKYETAREAVAKAIVLEPKNSSAHNLLGLVLSQQDEFHQARYHFYQARRHYHDDIVIKNNLAVIDLILGDYQGAVSKLESLYANETADEQVKANLAMAYAKLGNYPKVEQMLGNTYSDEQLEMIFVGLRAAQPYGQVGSNAATSIEVEQEFDVEPGVEVEAETQVASVVVPTTIVEPLPTDRLDGEANVPE
ncbi:hypothetical protein [Vibrio sp. SCSIO 43136]|uniref:hypothetical protein n=1 Tax=Vibrio sp. SCSIO 43136 TaxID=2819101 RepID=UPI002074D557|nr:hypothetical protein [Vibrio sp. SCSIO 43136]USD64734.1 hypothetical protein J4N39_11670 [Vibrio sp. SCSIO 43136]